MQISERLKSERKRLRLSQEAFALVGGCVRGTAYNWETGTGYPTADALAAWANVGLDVLYVVTGSRSFVPPPRLTSEQQTLLDYYQEASKEARKAALRALLAAAGDAPPGVKTGAIHQTSHAAGGVQVGFATGKVNVKTKGNK